MYVGTYMTVDVISELSFGKSLEMLLKVDNRWVGVFEILSAALMHFSESKYVL